MQSAVGGPLQASLTCQTHWVGNRMRYDCSSAEIAGLVWIPRWCEPHSHPCWPEGTRSEERSWHTQGFLGPVSGSVPWPPCFCRRTWRLFRSFYLLPFGFPRRRRAGKETCSLPGHELPFAFGSRSAAKEKKETRQEGAIPENGMQLSGALFDNAVLAGSPSEAFLHWRTGIGLPVFDRSSCERSRIHVLRRRGGYPYWSRQGQGGFAAHFWWLAFSNRQWWSVEIIPQCAEKKDKEKFAKWNLPLVCGRHSRVGLRTDQ